MLVSERSTLLQGAAGAPQPLGLDELDGLKFRTVSLGRDHTIAVTEELPYGAEATSVSGCFGTAA